MNCFLLPSGDFFSRGAGGSPEVSCCRFIPLVLRIVDLFNLKLSVYALVRNIGEFTFYPPQYPHGPAGSGRAAAQLASVSFSVGLAPRKLNQYKANDRPCQRLRPFLTLLRADRPAAALNLLYSRLFSVSNRDSTVIGTPQPQILPLNWQTLRPRMSYSAADREKHTFIPRSLFV